MATIVNGAKRIRVVGKAGAPRPANRQRPYLSFTLRSEAGRRSLVISGSRSVRSVIPDLATLTAHFGLSEAACVRMAVRLLANAVRAGRFALGQEGRT
jgi:hypothetical protein